MVESTVASGSGISGYHDKNRAPAKFRLARKEPYFFLTIKSVSNILGAISKMFFSPLLS